MEIQDWAQSFHAEMRTEKKFGDLLVGDHASLEEVLNDFISFLEAKKPPRKIKLNVTLTESQ